MSRARRLILTSVFTSAPSEQSSSWVGVLMVVTAAFGFSLSIIFVRHIEGLDVTTITFFRSLSAFLMYAALLPRFREPLHFARYRRYIPHLIGLGAAMCLTALLYTYALQHTTAANAALLNNTSPLYVALIAPWLLKETRPRWTWPALALAGVGIVLITNPGQFALDSDSMRGILAAIASGVCYALPMLIGRTLRSHVNGMTQIWWGSGITALLLSPFVLRGDLSPAISQLHLLIPLGMVALGLPYLLMFQGLRRCTAQVVSVAALMEPVFGTLIGLILFGEMFTLAGGLGAVLVLASIYLISRNGGSKTIRPQAASATPTT